MRRPVTWRDNGTVPGWGEGQGCGRDHMVSERRSGLMRGALYVVRPDGYAALADPDGDPGRLGRYLMSRGLPVALRCDEATRFEPCAGSDL